MNGTACVCERVGAPLGKHVAAYSDSPALLATAWLRHSLRRRSGVRADTRRLGELPRSIVEHHRANGDARPLRGLQAHRLPEFETATTRTTRAIRLRVSGKIERADSGKHCKHYGASAEISQ